MLAISLVIGAVSETYFTPQSGGWDDDFQRAFDLVSVAVNGDRPKALRLLGRCVRIAERLTELGRRDIQRVTIALLKQEELNREQVLLNVSQPVRAGSKPFRRRIRARSR
jgi:hypothetical protein